MNFYIGIQPCNHHPYQHIGHLASDFFLQMILTGSQGWDPQPQQTAIRSGADTSFSALPQMPCVFLPPVPVLSLPSPVSQSSRPSLSVCPQHLVGTHLFCWLWYSVLQSGVGRCLSHPRSQELLQHRHWISLTLNIPSMRGINELTHLLSAPLLSFASPTRINCDGRE